MSLLLDENLSPRLVGRLGSLFPGLRHARDAGLKEASDPFIREWAKENGYNVVTTDADFVKMSGRLGWPPKIIHLERCDFPFGAIEELLRRNAVRISEFERDAEAGLLRLRFRGCFQ